MKNNRQKAIAKIITEKVIDTQEMLLDELKNAGFTVTQATISRDIKAMNIIKTLDDDGNYRYALNSVGSSDNSDRYTEIFKKSAISIKSAMNDIVIKCFSGTANAACAAIDNLYQDRFIGTLAGDDTIFVITEDEQKAQELVATLNSLLDM